MYSVMHKSTDPAQPDPFWLVADIGGTHARFALAQASDLGSARTLAHVRKLRVADHENLVEAVQHYLKEIPPALKPRTAIFAVACAVTSDAVQFTNSRWNFSVRALQATLGLEALMVANDFAAAARAVPGLGRDDLISIRGCVAQDRGEPGMRVVLGPGTGLGLAALEQNSEGVARVLETEGGHVGFAPRDAEELYILEYLRQRFGRVSYERVLGGHGWLNLYQAWAHRLGRAIACQTPEEVSAAARGGDVAAMKAARSMSSILGSYAGDAVLMFGAWQGVYLAGALLAHMFNDENEDAFRTAFQDKGRFTDLVSQIPVLRIINPDLGNLGAAALGADWIRQQLAAP